ncbi:hypothetical protein GCM10022267_31710 [Lentzea roselyniae]|uniref:Uncharacterized protein n=1 Tax=Lentzea roselyniae TaxID=531940 RepID=A0ABP7AXA2_9PSEU
MKAVQPPPEPLDGVAGGLVMLDLLAWVFFFFVVVACAAVLSGLLTGLVFGAVHLLRRSRR